jgi:protein-S-isoprenylcysteine O-methyltransferase Ste14
MWNNFLTNPFFWISVYFIGFIIAIIMLCLPRLFTGVEKKLPKALLKVYILSVFIAPPMALPFTKGPKIAISTPIALIVGIALLSINFLIKILAQRQIGACPGLKRKAKLITTGIYGIVRNPLYMSNGLLAVGMAVLLKSMYALIFSIPYSLSYLLIIYFEEKDLMKKYGNEYQEYMKKVPYRIIPRLF